MLFASWNEEKTRKLSQNWLKVLSDGMYFTYVLSLFLPICNSVCMSKFSFYIRFIIFAITPAYVFPYDITYKCKQKLTFVYVSKQTSCFVYVCHMKIKRVLIEKVTYVLTLTILRVVVHRHSQKMWNQSLYLWNTLKIVKLCRPLILQ